MLVNINIISGFLGAGKTTFLKKILPNIDGKIAIIENEFGDTGLDGILLNSDSNIPVREISSGCICCSLATDLKNSIEDLIVNYSPNHIFIEPSGVASLSDILKLFKKFSDKSFSIKLNYIITIVDALSYEDSLESFGAFYMDQIVNAKAIFLSHQKTLDSHKIESLISELKQHNPNALIFTDNWLEIDDTHLIESLYLLDDFDLHLNSVNSLKSQNEVSSFSADTIFESYSIKKLKPFMETELAELPNILKKPSNGNILRAKGIISLSNDKKIHFNFTPRNFEWEYTDIDISPQLVIIGSKLNSLNIANYFTHKNLQSIL